MRRTPLLLAVAGLLLAVVVAVVLLTRDGDDADAQGLVRGPQQAPFTVVLPPTWAPEDAAEATLSGERRPGQVLTARRRGGGGTLTVTAAGPLREDARQLGRGLTRRLSRRFDDFRLVSAGVERLDAASAFLFTYTQGGQVQTIAVFPAGRRSFTLNAVLPAQAREGAREAAGIIRSFDPTPEA